MYIKSNINVLIIAGALARAFGQKVGIIFQNSLLIF